MSCGKNQDGENNVKYLGGFGFKQKSPFRKKKSLNNKGIYPFLKEEVLRYTQHRSGLIQQFNGTMRSFLFTWPPSIVTSSQTYYSTKPGKQLPAAPSTPISSLRSLLAVTVSSQTSSAECPSLDLGWSISEPISDKGNIIPGNIPWGMDVGK